MNVRLVVTTAHRLALIHQDPIPALVELDIKIMDMGTVLVRLLFCEAIIVFCNIAVCFVEQWKPYSSYYLITVFFVLLL